MFATGLNKSGVSPTSYLQSPERVIPGAAEKRGEQGREDEQAVIVLKERREITAFTEFSFAFKLLKENGTDQRVSSLRNFSTRL